MFTPRRQALALAGVLAATTITGGALITRLAAHPAASSPAIHRTISLASSPAASAPSVQVLEHEGGDS